MDKIKTPIRVFKNEDSTERVTKVFKTVDLTFGVFKESNQYPNLKMDGSAHFELKQEETDAADAGKKKKRVLAAVAVKTSQDKENLVG